MRFGSRSEGGRLALGTTFVRGVVALGVVAAGSVAPAEALAVDNLPPLNTVPWALSVNEDANLILSGPDAISVSDPDAGPAVVQVALTATQGVLTLGGTTGLSFVSGDGTGDPTLTVQGTIADLNTALDGTVYDSDVDFNGAAELTVTTDDLGNAGDPPAETDTDVVPITVNAVNDNPVNSLPPTQTIDEDTTLTFSAATANAVSISDVDAAGDDLRVSLSTTPSGGFATGTVTVDDRAPLTFTSGDGVDDASMAFEGTLGEINAALDGMAFTPNRDMYGTGYSSGAGTLRVATNDLGHNPSSAKTDTDELAIHINPVDDDGPTIRIISGIGTYEDVPEMLSLANGNQLQVVDLDSNGAGADQLEVSLASTNGTMTLGSTADLTFTTGDGAGDTAMTFTGVRSAVVGAFDTGLAFTPEVGFTGTAQITADIEDHTPGAAPGPGHAVGEIEVDARGEAVYYGGFKVTGTTVVPSVGAVLGRAGLHGGGGANLYGGPTVADGLSGIAIDLVDEKIYWSVTNPSSSTPRIYRAALDGSGTPEVFVAGNALPTGTVMNSTPGALIVDQTTRRLYWTSHDNTPPVALANKSISYVSLDGAVPATEGGTVPVSTGNSSLGGPRTFALDVANDRFFFGDTTGDAVGMTPVPGADGTNGRFSVTGAIPSDPLGIAYDPATDRLYWGNSSGDPADGRIRYADLNGTTSITGQVFDIGASAGGGFRGLALDPAANRLYWGLASGAGSIEHASLAGDGSDSGAVDLGNANHNALSGVTLLKDPEPVSPPTISGTAGVGRTLTCGDVTWAPDLVSGSLYRMATSTWFGGWTRDGDPIEGADDPTLTPTAVGEYRCSREASNFAGTSRIESAPVTISAPGAVDDVASVAEDSGATTIDVIANDTGAPTSVVATTNAAHGTVQLAGGGSGLTYAPDANYCGTDTFTYTLPLGSTATVMVTVACADDASVAVADSFTVGQDSGPTAIDVLANDTDIDGGIAITSASDPAHGSVAVAPGGGGLTYRPDAGFCGRDPFTYALGGGSTAAVSVTVSSCTFDRALTLAYKDRKKVFKGRLTSSESACVSAKVVVFRKRAGDDRRVGSDRTSATGSWSVAEPDADGRFYATTVRRTVASGTCAAVTSPTRKVGPATSRAPWGADGRWGPVRPT